MPRSPLRRSPLRRPSTSHYTPAATSTPTTWDYYVANNGSDSANGTSEATPFLTLAKINGLGSMTGKRVALRRGDVFRETLHPNAQNMVIGAYGTGALPRITGGNVLTTWNLVQGGPGSGSGDLFTDGFESETTSFNTNWNGKTEAGSSTVTLETSAPLTATKSLKYSHTSAGTAYITKTIARDELYVQFRVKVQTLVNGSAFGVCTILQMRTALMGTLNLGHDGTPANGLRFSLTGPGGISYVGPTSFHQGDTITVELHYKRGASSNGGNELWINGDQVYSNLGVTTNFAVDSFRFGCPVLNANGYGTGSVLLFDDVKVGTAYIGTNLGTAVPANTYGNSTTNVNAVMVDGTPAPKQFSLSALTEGDWYSNNTTVYYRSATGTAGKTIEGSVRASPVILDQNGQTLQDVQVDLGTNKPLALSTASNITVQRVRLTCSGQTTSSGALNILSCTNPTILYCTIDGIYSLNTSLGQTPIAMWEGTGLEVGWCNIDARWCGEFSNAIITNGNTASEAYSIHHNYCDMTGSNTQKHVINVGASIVLTAQNNLGGYVGYNTTLGGNGALSINNSGPDADHPTLVEHNFGSGYGLHADRAADVFPAGVFCGVDYNVSHVTVRYNTFVNGANGIESEDLSGDGGSNDKRRINWKVYNNTIAGMRLWGIRGLNNLEGDWRNNIFWDCVSGAVRVDQVGSGGLTMDYNDLGPEATGFVSYLLTTYNTLAAYTAARSQEAHGLTVEPQFVTEYTNMALAPTSPLLTAGDPALSPVIGSGGIIPVSGPAPVRYVTLPGTTGEYISTTDKAALDLTGDLDLRVLVALDDWVMPGGTEDELIAKANNYVFIQAASGILTLFYYTPSFASISSSVGHSFVDGTKHWLRVTLDVDDGASGRTIRFYTAAPVASGEPTWTQLGTDRVVATPVTLGTSSNALNVGSRSGTDHLLNGKVYRAQVRNGIDGTLVADYNASSISVTGTRTPTTYADSVGNTWTMNGSAWNYGVDPWGAP